MVHLQEIIERLATEPVLYKSLDLRTLVLFLSLCSRLRPEIELSSPPRSRTENLELPSHVLDFLRAALYMDKSDVLMCWKLLRDVHGGNTDLADASQIDDMLTRHGQTYGLGMCIIII